MRATKTASLALLVAAIVGGACRAETSLPPVHGSELKDVSLIALIANPTEYDGKLVRVTGFCRLQFEGNALYLHREDFERGILRNAVWLTLEWPVPENLRDVSDEYVLVEAVFDAENKGHMGAFSGGLREIRRMQRSTPRVEFERSQRLAPRQ